MGGGWMKWWMARKVNSGNSRARLSPKGRGEDSTLHQFGPARSAAGGAGGDPSLDSALDVGDGPEKHFSRLGPNKEPAPKLREIPGFRAPCGFLEPPKAAFSMERNC